MSIDRDKMPDLISRRQYNDRRKYTADPCERIRKRIVECIDGGEDIFIIDSKPVKVCQLSIGERLYCLTISKHNQ